MFLNATQIMFYFIAHLKQVFNPLLRSHKYIFLLLVNFGCQNDLGQILLIVARIGLGGAWLLQSGREKEKKEKEGRKEGRQREREKVASSASCHRIRS
jgi:hypothetical protein